MAANGPPNPLRDVDYDALFHALSGSSQGRWFLDEYLRRNQKPETQMVLDAISRLERAMVRDRTVPDIDRIRLNIADMQEAIERTKREIGNIKHESEYGNRFQEASDELDAIVTQTERATEEVLAASEAIQEIAWQLREEGANEKACDDIDARATEIFMACSFQDLTGQRTQKIVQVLHYLESRINLMINIWGMEKATAKDLEIRADARPDAHLLNGPQLEGRGRSQDAVDALFDELDVAFDPNSEDMSDNEGDGDNAAPDLDNIATADVFAQPIAENDAGAKAVEEDGLGFVLADAAIDDDDEVADVFARPIAKKTEQRDDAVSGDGDESPSPQDAADNVMAGEEVADLEEATSDINWEAEIALMKSGSENKSDELSELSAGERQALFS